MNKKTDEELMMMFKTGNSRGFEILFERYRTRLFTFIFRMLGQKRETAEDLFQEVYINVYKGKDFYEPTSRFSSWLFTIARNHCLNYLKSQKYKESLKTGSLDSEGFPEPSVPGTADAGERDNRLMLENALSTLSETYREIVLLRAVEGFSSQEIGEMLNMNPTTVRSNYYRARMELKKKLLPVLEGGE